jgi:hypothetical protein
VANSKEQLHSVLATLEDCQAVLIGNGNQETAQLVSVAILELRMKLYQVADSELKALCDAMLRDDALAERSQGLKSPQNQPTRPLLKLVK